MHVALTMAFSLNVLSRIAKCNLPPPAPLLPFFLPSSSTAPTITSNPLGYISSEIAEVILETTPGFVRTDIGLTLASSTVTSQNSAIASAARALRDKGYIPGWRDELTPLVHGFTDLLEQTVDGSYEGLTIERGAAGLFSARGFGVHVNGYVKSPQGEVKLWVSTRSLSKSVCPGMLDHIVAGGIPSSHPHPTNNVIKECEEEANIPESLARLAIPVGSVSFSGMDNWNYENGQLPLSFGYRRDTLFCYDLELPSSFVPTPNDGEVSSFQLMSIDEIVDRFEKKHTEGEAFKGNCYLVLADFLVRHGYIKPDNAFYCEIVENLHR
jgi:hypothetical protein